MSGETTSTAGSAIRPNRFGDAAIIGNGQSRYVRKPEPGALAHHFMRDAIVAALADCEMSIKDIDGFAVSSLSMTPDSAIDLIWRLGISVKWLHQDTTGGSSSINSLFHALAAVQTGAASAVLVVGGDATGLAGYAKIAANFNRAIRDHAAPMGYGGPNTAYAMLTGRQMQTFGLEKRDYGHMAIAQRQWAALNPLATYRTPLTMEDYLAAPMVASPLCRFDCVPVVAGAQALIVSSPDRGPKGRRPVRIKAIRMSFNHDNQADTGLKTGISTFAPELWAEAGVGPEDVDVASIYDDYPAMVLAQLNDLGFVPDHDLKSFINTRLRDRSLPINTWGGMMSAGQPGGPAGGLNGIAEMVMQLQGRAEARQVRDAKLALSTGYGMTIYRYGATAGAVVLEG